MARPNSTVFSGSLKLDQGYREAYLVESPPAGPQSVTLMMLDPAPVSPYSQQLVDQAYQLAYDNHSNKDPLQIKGFKAVATPGNALILHVTDRGTLS